MRRTLYVDGAEKLELIERSYLVEEGLPEGIAAVQFSDERVALALLRRFKQDVIAMTTLRNVALHVSQRHSVGYTTDSDAITIVARALASGSWALLAQEVILGGLAGKEKTDDADDADGVIPPPTGVERQTWIEVRLLYPDGRPVAHEPYVLKTPDGNTRTGELDGEGTVFLEDIDPGSCEVTFPKVDEERRLRTAADRGALR